MNDIFNLNSHLNINQVGEITKNQLEDPNDNEWQKSKKFKRHKKPVDHVSLGFKQSLPANTDNISLSSYPLQSIQENVKSGKQMRPDRMESKIIGFAGHDNKKPNGKRTLINQNNTNMNQTSNSSGSNNNYNFIDSLDKLKLDFKEITHKNKEKIETNNRPILNLSTDDIEGSQPRIKKMMTSEEQTRIRQNNKSENTFRPDVQSIGRDSPDQFLKTKKRVPHLNQVSHIDEQTKNSQQMDGSDGQRSNRRRNQLSNHSQIMPYISQNNVSPFVDKGGNQKSVNAQINNLNFISNSKNYLKK